MVCSPPAPSRPRCLRLCTAFAFRSDALQSEKRKEVGFCIYGQEAEKEARRHVTLQPTLPATPKTDPAGTEPFKSAIGLIRQGTPYVYRDRGTRKTV